MKFGLIRFGLILWMVCATRTPISCEELGVTVKNLNGAGAVSVSNSGPATRVKKSIVIEQLSDSEWKPTGAYFDLIERCGDAHKMECRELKTGASLTLVAWNGYSCSGQCSRPCRSNSYLGPGTFRFVVVRCDGKKRFEGAPFDLPAVAPGGVK